MRKSNLAPYSQVVIFGAGMAGVAAAHELARNRGVRGRIVLVDEREPLSLTSAKGTEAYRDWWPDPCMARFMARSIDRLEALAQRTDFGLSRNGYAFFTADPVRAVALKAEAEGIAGADGVRLNAPGPPHARGADLVTDRKLLRSLFPWAAEDACAVLWARRCGWLDAQRLGRALLAESGAEVVRDRVIGVDVKGGRVAGGRLAGGGRIGTEALVLAPGPKLKEAGALLGLDLPVFCELHGKLAFPCRALPPDAPMAIWLDPVRLPWPDAPAHLRGELPGGVHARPRGDGELLLIWTYDVQRSEPLFPPRFDPHYGEALVRGLARMVPGMKQHFGRAGEGVVDGGYYCKTRENRPLVGPLPVEGAFVIGALSGFGIMGSQAAAELLGAHVAGAALPPDAAEFHPARYDDPAYVARLPALEATAGQL